MLPLSFVARRCRRDQAIPSPSSTLVARRGFAATFAQCALCCGRNQPDERAMNAKLRELKDKNLTEP